MKLRRVMAAAATTAVIAPLALLSAPAAFATSPEPTASESTSSSPSPAPSTTETTPPSSTPATTPPSSEIPSGTPNPSGSTTPSGSPSPTSGPSDEPTDPDEDAPYCEDLDENYGDAKVSADIKGLPGKIVAGDGIHDFDLVVTNESKETVKGVAFYAEIENFEVDESKYLSPYVTLEFKNTDSGKWERIGDENWAGDYFFYAEALKANASQKVDLRLSIAKGAPAGDSYSFGSGAYVDSVNGEDCIAEGWAQYDFEVLKTGTTNPDPDASATPNDNDGKGKDDKDGVKKPQGNVSDLPTGNLAETGSNSALPTIGLVGGAALVAGAGAVFIARRRKAGSDV